MINRISKDATCLTYYKSKNISVGGSRRFIQISSSYQRCNIYRIQSCIRIIHLKPLSCFTNYFFTSIIRIRPRPIKPIHNRRSCYRSQYAKNNDDSHQLDQRHPFLIFGQLHPFVHKCANHVSFPLSTLWNDLCFNNVKTAN